VGRIATAGHWNALARVVLQLTSPGVADTYQGDELWLFALVDPDNRRPVDYKRRQELLATVSAPGALHALEPWDERLKLGVVQRLLNMRRDRASLFTGGGYVPLQVQGSLARHVVAFARTSETERAIVVAPRLMQSATPRNSAQPDWQDTAVLLPEPLRAGSFRSVLGDGEVRLVEASTTLALGELLSNLPVAVLLSL